MVKKQRSATIIFLAVILIILGLSFFKEPAITGRVIEGRETVFSENLNLEVNESGTYEWNVKNPGSIKSLKLSGSVSSNGSAKVFIEKNGTRQLLFDSTNQLFDVDIHVLPEYKKISQGNEMLMQIVLFNLRGFGKGDINVEYSVKDSKGNLIATQQESVYIETQARFVRKLLMPEEIKPGTYTAFVEASANATIVGTGSDTFEIVPKYPYQYAKGIKPYLIGFAVLMALVISLLLLNYKYGLFRKKKKIEEMKERLPLEKMQKLGKELKALESAYKSGFISGESYKRDKKRIEEKLK